MKIISGKYKGRIIKGYDIDGTRPTMDRVKESMFAMIQNYLNDSIVLDLFAGTGSLGLEALSNGAKYGYFVDLNSKCLKNISDNINSFGLNDNTKLLNLDYKKALEYFKNNNIIFDIIFLDPPYKLDIVSDIINYINKNKLLNNNGIIVCEVLNNNLLDKYDNLSKIKMKKYNDKYVILYR